MGGFDGYVQMGINIGCGRKISVAEPLVELFHRDADGEPQRRTTMTKLVEANFDKIHFYMTKCDGGKCR